MEYRNWYMQKEEKLKFEIFSVQNPSAYFCFNTRIFPRIYNKIMHNVFAVFHVEVEAKSEFLILFTR
jgi:hypothetical protein